jgi:hypothetical protein
MAGMFYSIKEVCDKLGKTEDDIRQFVKTGRLREFRDGPNLLFKVDEVTALLSDTSAMGLKKPEEKPAPAAKPAAKKPPAEAEEILLAPETAEPEKTGEEIVLTDADTQIVDEGIKVLGETDTASALKDTGDETFKGLQDTKGLSETPSSPAKEASLEEIEKDVSLETFGSGSGLLDLSLQADDTSLGGILDEIYTTPGGEEKPAAAEAGTAVPAGTAEGSAMEVAAEADHIMPEAQFPESQITAPSAAALAYAEPQPDAMSNALGIMLLIPFAAVIYTAIVAVAAFSNMAPSMLSIVKSVQGFIWYIVGGMAVASGLIAAVGATMTGEKKPKTPKPPKPPKVKKEKPPKPVKEKKAK